MFLLRVIVFCANVHQSSRRHTRRPEKQGPSSGSAAPTESPFTRTPLENKRVTPTPTPSTPQYPYAYSPYPPQHPSQPPTQSQSQPPHPNDAGEDTGEGSDAWEAAQNILKAINFGSLIHLGSGSAHVNPVLRGTGTSGEEAQEEAPVAAVVPALATELGAHDRAALQAQLALLAAQMAELAEEAGGGGEEALADGLSAAMRGVPLTRVADEDYDVPQDGDGRGEGEEGEEDAERDGDKDGDGDGEGEEDEDEDEDMERVDIDVEGVSIQTQ